MRIQTNQLGLTQSTEPTPGLPIARRRRSALGKREALHLEAPYLEALGWYAARQAGRFHVPGHKGGAGAPPHLAHYLGEALALDIPLCIEGIDIGAEPTPLQRAEFLAARTWGARRTWFLVNGASEASHVACLTLAQAGGRVVVQRNAHSSTMHGLVLSGLSPVFAAPEIDMRLGIAHCLSPADLCATLDVTPDAVAAFVVSPTYFGAAADVQGLAAVCHERGVPLIVDEAWGAHFHFHERLPQDALRAGADLVISGTHKLMGSLTQSAMLHLGELDWPQLSEYGLSRSLALVSSTSPSSLLLGSLDAARAHAAGMGTELIDAALAGMDVLKEEIRAIDGLDVLDDRLVGHDSVTAYDPLRLAIDVDGAPCDGPALATALLEIADINLELITDRVLVAHVGIAEPILEHGQRLVDALRLALDVVAVAGADVAEVSAPPFGEPAMAPRDAFFAAYERVALTDAAGRISADSIVVYPPGIASILPGERVTAPVVRYLRDVLDRGGCLKGTWDAPAGTLTVVADEPDDPQDGTVHTDQSQQFRRSR
jgi:arginine decarboxylase